MTSEKPPKIMYLSPGAPTGGYDPVFAQMVLPQDAGTETKTPFLEKLCPDQDIAQELRQFTRSRGLDVVFDPSAAISRRSLWTG